MSGVTPLISNCWAIGSGVYGYSGDPTGYSWTGSAGPTGSATEAAGSGTGVAAYGVGNGIGFSVASSPVARTLNVYVGAAQATGRLQVLNGATLIYTDTSFSAWDRTDACYTIVVPANTALTIQWTAVAGSGGAYVTLQGATLTGLNVSHAATPSTVNLSTQGTADWSHWGHGGTNWDHKSGVTALISNCSAIGSGVYGYSGDPTGYSWTGSAGPTNSATEAAGSGTGVAAYGVGNGISFSVASSSTVRTLKVYVGAAQATGQLKVLNGATVMYTDASFSAWDRGDVCYTIIVPANTSLTIQWTAVSGTGGAYVTLQGATLA